MKSITLYFKQGSSDKVYQASIEPKNGGFVVNFAFGRRGTTLQTGTKTSSAVDYEAAKVIYEKLVRDKTAKGYTPGVNGTPYQHTDKEQDNTGIHPQLLNSIEEADLPRFIRDPAYWLQQKHDGRRLLLEKDGKFIRGINKLGLAVGIPSTLEQAACAFAHDFLIDGEIVGETLHAFDLLSMDGELVTGRAYTDRYLNLMNLLASGQQHHIKFVESSYLPKQKQDMLYRLKKEGAEGVVFKHLNAKYTPGRPESGGTQFKFKFCESASCISVSLNSGSGSGFPSMSVQISAVSSRSLNAERTALRTGPAILHPAFLNAASRTFSNAARSFNNLFGRDLRTARISCCCLRPSFSSSAFAFGSFFLLTARF